MIRVHDLIGVIRSFPLTRDHFFNYIPLETSGSSSKISVALKVLGTGMVAMKMTTEGVEKIITFSKTSHCPDVSVNLLSISHLDKEGWKITFGRGRADFVDPSRNSQFTASMFNDLYMINCNLMRGDKYMALAVRSLESSGPNWNMHMWFTHFGVDRIKTLSKGNLRWRAAHKTWSTGSWEVRTVHPRQPKEATIQCYCWAWGLRFLEGSCWISGGLQEYILLADQDTP